MKHSSLIQYSPKALQKVAKAIDTLAMAEGLPSHADSVKLRMRHLLLRKPLIEALTPYDRLRYPQITNLFGCLLGQKALEGLRQPCKSVRLRGENQADT